MKKPAMADFIPAKSPNKIAPILLSVMAMIKEMLVGLAFLDSNMIQVTKSPDQISNLYPTPLTVEMQSTPNFCRILRICTSMVLSPTMTSLPHILFKISFLKKTLPGLDAR